MRIYVHYISSNISYFIYIFACLKSIFQEIPAYAVIPCFIV
ncbi:hypothetical protein S3E15_05336 [Bacillus mycoides]|uniref:Uncharacterized protein n=1 Tax=Bacillus mycoides TaxID=1405 RepID=A0AAP7W7W0_BACMY|nr:hypothetical protein SZ39_4987 [Bacillus mycoides]KZD31268.1 hypothetical protein B4083_4649 [Bacillus cereus]KUH41020.1 hypothetical protein M2E15_4345 [Bacillus mycoides]KZE02054.1 hypothetical protein B4117_5526 [Bacillus mycoides]OSX89056.1 hypothetical protein BTJ44_04734 [Bacillus mycoides]